MNWGIFALLIFVVVKSQLIDHLMPQNFTAQVWGSTEQKLKEAKAIRFGAVPLTEDQMIKVLSLQLPNLEKIFFRTAAVKTVIEARRIVSAQTLTPKLLQLLFNSHYFPQLKILDLSGTNIDDRHLQFLREGSNRVSSLEILRLQDCLISRDGLALIGTTLKAGQLRELSLRNTLLVEEGSAETLLRLLCVFSEGRCNSPIAALDLSSSEIRVRELERLFLALDTSALRQLSLDQVTLVFDHTTAQVDYRALKALAQTSLLQLEVLNLRNTFLDDQAASIIGTISLPNLLQLSVSNNRISNNGMANLLVFKSKPKLQGLEVQQNLFRQEVLDIIINSQLQLKRLSATILKMTKNMSEMKTNNLEELRLTTTEDIYRAIIIYCDLSNLLWLEVTFPDINYQVTSSQEQIQVDLSQDETAIFVDFFSQLINDIGEPDLVDDDQNDDGDGQEWDNQLDEWLQEDYQQEQSDWQITDDTPTIDSRVQEDEDYNKLFPIYRLRKLKHLKLINFFYFRKWCYKPSQKNFSNPRLKQVSFQTSKGASINLQYFHQKYPNLKHFQIKMDSQQQKITVDFKSLKKQMYNLHFYLKDIEGRYLGSNTFAAKKYYMQEDHYIDQSMQWMWFLFGEYYDDDQNNDDDYQGIIFDYTQAQDLKVKNIDFFDKLSPSGRFTDIHLPLLKKLLIKNNVEVRDAIKLIHKVQMPLLESLDVSLNSDGAQPEALANFLNKLSVFRNLRSLRLRFNVGQSNTREIYYSSIFKGLYLPILFFPKLESIDLGSNNLETEHIAEFIATHNMTLRSIDLSFNFIERGFFSLLQRTNVTLTTLKLDNSYITLKDFLQLAKVNTYFIEVFSIPTSDLTDLHFTQMMDLKKREFSTKLMYLNINGNDVRNKALSSLFPGGMDHLSQLVEERSRELLNVLLKYPHQLKVIYSENIYGGLLDEMTNISSIRMNELIIDSIQSEEDLLKLGKLPFPSLRSLMISLYNIYNCSVLEAIFNISQSAQSEVIVNIYNQEVRLNSKCLSSSTFLSARVSTGSFQLNDHFSTTSLEQFAQMFISPKLKSLKLKNTRLPTGAITSILSADYPQLSSLVVPSNYFGEALASRIASRSFPQLYLVDLSFNNITQFSTSSLNYLLSNYQVELQGNHLGPDFCRQLNVRDKAFSLNVKRCGLRKDCLNNLLENPNIAAIKSINLSYNEIDEFQILEFILKAKQIFKNLRQLQAYGISISQDTYRIISKTTIYTSSNYEFDQIKFKNSAKY